MPQADLAAVSLACAASRLCSIMFSCSQGYALAVMQPSSSSSSLSLTTHREDICQNMNIRGMQGGDQNGGDLSIGRPLKESIETHIQTFSVSAPA